MDLLLNESAARSYSVLNTSELFNLNIQIHGRYIECGHSRNATDRRENEVFWRSIQTRRADREVASDTFHQKINRFQATMWYHYIQLNFEDALESAMNALTLFRLSMYMTVKDPDLYLRCLYYVSVFAYLTGDGHRMLKYQHVLDTFLSDDQILLNENSQRIGAIYRGLMTLNGYFQSQEWSAAATYAEQLRADYAAGVFRPTIHRWGQFLYKFAAICFVGRNYTEALDYLNEIINMKSGILREDLLLNARLLHLLCHYELDNRALVDYHLTNFTRQMRRSSETAGVHRLAATALRKLIRSANSEQEKIYCELDHQLQQLIDSDPFECKALLYLDLTQWTGLHLSPVPAAASAPTRP